MTGEVHSSDGRGWLEAIGLRHIARVLGFAVDPAKLGITVAAIILTFVLGGALDMIWKGTWGVDESAVARYALASRAGQQYEEPAGEDGIFHVWRKHQQSCVLGLLGTSVPGSSLAAGTNLGTAMQSHAHSGPLQNLLGLGYGMCWLATQHFCYFVLFGIGSLIIWSWGGGAVCRIAALQFAGDEKPTMAQADAYARRHLMGGFAPAPCIPLVGVALVMFLMVAGGVFLRIPVLGDLLAGTAFPLAILGGFVIAVLIVGTVVGGSLFWPAIAVEGQDAYDAFSRGLSYAFSKPWKTIVYGVITVVYAAVCWMFVSLFVSFALSITRAVVSFGTSPFGWWPRGDTGDPVSKMNLLWRVSGPDVMHSWPQWSRLAWYEYYSAFLIGVFVLLVIALMWAFLASFYFSGSTVVYFLLRRDVDGTDLEEIQVEEEALATAPSARQDSPADSKSTVSLPVVQAAPSTAAPPPSQPAPAESTDVTDTASREATERSESTPGTASGDEAAETETREKPESSENQAAPTETVEKPESSGDDAASPADPAPPSAADETTPDAQSREPVAGDAAASSGEARPGDNAETDGDDIESSSDGAKPPGKPDPTNTDL